MHAHHLTLTGRSIVVGAALSMVLAACSGGGGATTPASNGTTSGGASPTAAASDGPASSPGAAGAVDVCAVVTPDDLAAIASGPMTASPEPGLVGTAAGCVYLSKQFPANEGLSIEVVTGDMAANFWNGNVPPGGTNDTIPLTGIGDKAMRAPGAPDFVSLKGSTFCEIEAGSANTQIYSGLASPDASDNVPDGSATAFAEKLGQLCNKIFASR